MSSFFSRLRKPSKTDRLQRAASGEVSTLTSTQFAFRLFEALKPGDRNLAISPYSARVVLAMLCEGSTGETRKSMMDTLRLDEYPDYVTNHFERLGRPLGFQLETETERRGLEMLTANSLWCDDGFVRKPEYVNTLKEHYWAEVQTLDFRDPLSAEKVNRWAHEKTRGRIPTVDGSLEYYSPLVTMNAVYFKGLWVEPFEVEETREEEFTLQDGAKQLVPLMRQSGEFRYAEIGGAVQRRNEHARSASPKEHVFPKVLRRADQHRRNALDSRHGPTRRPPSAAALPHRNPSRFERPPKSAGHVASLRPSPRHTRRHQRPQASLPDGRHAERFCRSQ